MALSCSKKILFALLRWKKSEHRSDFYFLSCLHSSAAEHKRESHKNLCENKDFYNVVMRFKDTKILEFNKYQKTDKASFVIYADHECLIEQIDGYKNYPENSSTTKVREDILSGLSMSAILSFKSIENKHDVHRVKTVWKRFVNPKVSAQ